MEGFMKSFTVIAILLMSFSGHSKQAETDCLAMNDSRQKIEKNNSKPRIFKTAAKATNQ
jgi:hypothetical protein